ncbi:MAG: sulfatase [Planctomycetota bacterium]
MRHLSLFLRALAPLIAALTAFACADPESHPPAAPNVVLFVADDQGLFLGAYGSDWVSTPHLDRLAAGGLVFDGAYAVTAVCTPSRAALYTGQFPAGNGCAGFDPIGEGVPVWADLLGPAGYRTGLIGKLGGKPLERFHFDFFARALPNDEGARSASWFDEKLRAFLAQDDGRPFCLVVNLRDAHYPFPTDGAPTGVPGEVPHDPALVQVPGFLPDLPAVRGELARYADSVRRLDATVGRMLQTLDGSVERDGLLVLHTSDHGSPFPFAKTTLYEAGVRVPLVARWPGTVEPGRRSGALVSLADVLPTLLELGGATPPSGLDGRSFAELLRGEREDHRDSIFLSHTSHRVKPDVPSRALRRERWKYVRNLRPGATFLNAVMRTSASWRAIEAAAAGDDALAGRIARLRQRPPEELYDLEVDPFELSNLAGAAAHAATLDALRKELRAELERQSDPLLGEW